MNDAVCVTVDVEDWIQSTYDFERPVTERARTNTLAQLDFFDRLGVRGTFFVQGLVAEAFPDLVREIARRGHEVGSHAHSHRPLWPMEEAALRRELRGSKERLEDLTGEPVEGFRAPDFSIGPPAKDLDGAGRRVFTMLAEAGYAYDSSVVPARVRRYGVARAPGSPFALREGLVEVPLSTFKLVRRLPALGGGYLRLFPLPVHRLALRQAAREGRVPVLYLHPYEMNASELGEWRREVRIPLTQRLTQGVGRRTAGNKLTELLGGRRCVAMGELVKGLDRGALAVL